MIRSIFFLAIFSSILGTVNAQKVSTEDLSKLTDKLNSRFDEQNPVLSPDGMVLYFTRANDSLNIGGPRDKGDIWYSVIGDDGTWSSPENLGAPVNDDLRNYILGFSPDGEIMFLNQEKRFPGGVVVNDGIAYSVRSGGQWSKPSKASVDYLINKSKHQSGSISADGSIMMLSLQAYASRGEEDIYVSQYANGGWTQPKNLGSVINTSSQEMTPYLSPDKKKLYFSSNGHGGKGGRDLFVSERLDDSWTSWSKPKNLGSEVNSFGVELGYFIDQRNEIAYFSTTQNSDGYGDIQANDITIEIEEEPVVEVVAYEELIEQAEEERKTFLLSGKITREDTSEPIAVALLIEGDGISMNINNQEDGTYQAQLPVTASSVTISVKSPGFMNINYQLELNGENTYADFVMMPLEVGATIRLNKVYFSRGTADLLEESFAELNQVVDMMMENPTVKIELSGHTDNQGSSKLNVQLSQQRVEKVEQYMIEHGIDGKRIKGKGYGGSRPVASNASEETRKLNRRVEIKILKN